MRTGIANPGPNRWTVVRPTLGVLVALVRPLAAQTPAAAPGPSFAEPGSSLTIAVMTMGIGAHPWERFGHNAIVVEDRARGTRVSYNYGMFSFRQANFLLRFVQGRMWYWVDSVDTDWDVPRYLAAHRSVWWQELNLTPAERLALRDFLEWNVREEHRFYRYDYYRDNCSTRVRDALDRVLGGAIKARTDTVRTGVSYRFHTQRLNRHDPLLYTGLLLAVGRGGDREITAWEEMFLPLKLRDHLRLIEVPDSAGRPVPLVRAERTIYLSDVYQEPAAPPGWVPAYLAIGVVLGSLMALPPRFGERGSAPAGPALPRYAFLVVAGAWCLLAGLAGVVLAGLWAFTDHTIAAQNENLFQLTPLALALLPLLARGLAGHDRWLRGARRLAQVGAALSALGLVTHFVPGFYQGNAEILALALPANVGLWLGVEGWVRRR